MKKLFFLLVTLSLMSFVAEYSIHQYKIQRLNSDQTLDLRKYKGKKMLLVNIASHCGYASQLRDLQTLSTKYHDKLVVIGFPCNQFEWQEPGTEIEIQIFCKKTYGVSFPLTTKIDVKGENQHPIYKYLTTKELNHVSDFKVTWNFNKFLLDENGKILARFEPDVNPLDSRIVKYIE